MRNPFPRSAWKIRCRTSAQFVPSDASDVLCRASGRGACGLVNFRTEKLSGLARFLSLPATTLKGTQVDREIRDGDVLPEMMGGLQVVGTPGHSPDHLAFWQPENRVLFCGDVILRLPKLRLPYGLFTVDMEQNKRSVRRVTELDPAIVCFGHGKPMTENTAHNIHSFAKKIRVL